MTRALRDRDGVHRVLGSDDTWPTTSVTDWPITVQLEQLPHAHIDRALAAGGGSERTHRRRKQRASKR